MSFLDEALEKAKRLARKHVVVVPAGATIRKGGVTITSTSMQMTFDRDAVSVVTVAKGRAPRPLTAETLLAAALEDEDIAPLFTEAARVEIHRAASAPGGADGQDARTGSLVRRAVARAREQGRSVVSRGDLLESIGASPTVAGRLVREAKLDVGRFDARREDPMPEEAIAPSAHSSLAIHLLDDDASQLDDVTDVLTTAFGAPADRALYLAVRTHHVSHARVGRYRTTDAMALVAAATVMARNRKMPLAFRLVAA